MNYSTSAAFLPSPLPSASSACRRPKRGRRSTGTATCPIRMATPSSSSSSPYSSRPPTAARVLRLERALAAAVEQERYTDAATLRDALEAERGSDPLFKKREELAAAVMNQDFVLAAKLRDEIATLTERCARGEEKRQVDRIVILRGRADPGNTLRVATVSPDGDLQLPLFPLEDKNDNSFSTNSDTDSTVSSMNSEGSSMKQQASGIPRVFLQPTWSPTGDYIAMTEIAFFIDATRVTRGIAVAETESKLIIMNALDGSVVQSVALKKPPFFYFWSPDGKTVTLLSNDPTSTVSTVALSALQVVAAKGGEGLDTQSVTGPLVSGHPLLYDFNQRDPSKIIVHMGDCNTVAVLKMSTSDRTRRVLTSSAGTFGTPQWHPCTGENGREVVLFVEAEEEEEEEKDDPSKSSSEDSEKDSDSEGSIFHVDGIGAREEGDNAKADGKEKDGNEGAFEKFVSNGSSLLESVFKKGVESLGWMSPFSMKGKSDKDDAISELDTNVSNVESRLQKLEDKLRSLLGSSSLDSLDDKDDLSNMENKNRNGDVDDGDNLIEFDLKNATNRDGNDDDDSIVVEIIDGSENVDIDVDDIQINSNDNSDGNVEGKWIVASVSGDELNEQTALNLSERIKQEIERKIKAKAKEIKAKRLNLKQGKVRMQRLVMCDVEKPELRRTIARFSGVMAFKLSPNGKSIATLITNPLSGDDELSIRNGNFEPDSVVQEDEKQFQFPSFKNNKNQNQDEQKSADILLSTPSNRVIAFFWSPDSSKLLFLSSLRNSMVGAAQWATYDLNTCKVVRYEKFIMSGIYIQCLNFFDQFALSMTPWSPDSKRFCYPGRPLTKKEMEKDDSINLNDQNDMSVVESSSALSALFVQKDSTAVLMNQRKFVARVQKVPDTSNIPSGSSKIKPEPAKTIVDNVEYACWSPC